MTGHAFIPPPTLVVGLGRTGLSVVRHLCARGVPVTVADSRAAPPLFPEFRARFPDLECRRGAFDARLFARFGSIVVSPGVSLREPALRAAHAQGARLVGDVELFARETRARVIAVTGSNGKSTVTRLAADMLAAAGFEARVGGNIGPPVLELLEPPAPRLAVLELSSFQLETTESLAPQSAAVLNVSADHMDRYADFDDYARAKGRIYRRARTRVVNRADARAAALASGPARGRVSFGLDEPARGHFGVRADAAGRWLCHGARRLMLVSELRLEGAHNVSNALAAFALIAAAGIEIDASMMDAARAFGGLPHRMELVLERGGVRWINDSKGTNVGATRAALEGIGAPVILIAGGRSKGADLGPLADGAGPKVRHALLFGEDRALLDRALAGVTTTRLVDDLREAVAHAARVARRGEVVLFSPACASFDMFENFERRGEAFRAAVLETQA